MDQKVQEAQSAEPRQIKRRRKKFERLEIAVGIKKNAPIEYDLIMSAVGDKKAPSADLIEAISYSSANPYFRSALFREILIDYRENGLKSRSVPKVRDRKSKCRLYTITEAMSGLFKDIDLEGFYKQKFAEKEKKLVLPWLRS